MFSEGEEDGMAESRDEAAVREWMLEDLLQKVLSRGFVETHLRDLYRLTRRGNRSAGFYAELLSAWRKIGGNADSLHFAEFAGERVIIASAELHQIRHLVES
jgi:hypothetical protein